MEKYKIVICTLSAKYIHASLGIWYLHSALINNSKSNIDVKVLESSINDDINTFTQRILDEKPNFVGLSCYIWNIDLMYKIINIIKEYDPNIIICLGGPEVSYNQKEVFNKNNNIDFIIASEGEKPMVSLVDSLVNNLDYTNINNLSYKDINNNIITNKIERILDDPVNPYTKEFYDNLNGKIAYIETSRGCPYTCAFCLSGRDNPARFFNLEETFNNIINLGQTNTQTIKFVDRTFNCNIKRTLQILDFLLNNPLVNRDITYHFEIAGDILNDDIINMFSKAPNGLFQVEIGLQSFNEITLEYITRKTNTTKLKNNIIKLRNNNNMHIHIDLIVGLPYEDFNSFKESFNIAYKLNPHDLQVGFLKVLHGAEMKIDPIKFPLKYHDYTPYEIIETPFITKDEINKIRYLEDVLERLYNSQRFINTINYLLDKTKLEPFDLYYDLGIYLSQFELYKISLDNYMKLIYDKYINDYKLRDYLIMDKLITNNSKQIPSFLKNNYINNKKIKNYISNIYNLYNNHIIYVLDSINKVLIVEYYNIDKVTHRYPYKVLDLLQIEKNII